LAIAVTLGLLFIGRPQLLASLRGRLRLRRAAREAVEDEITVLPEDHR